MGRSCRCGNISAHSSLRFVWIHLCTSRSISVWLSSALWLDRCSSLILLIFSLSVGDLLLLGIIVLLLTPFGFTFDSRILWFTEEFTVNSITASRPRPVAAKWGRIISPPPLSWQSVWGICADMLRFGLSNCAAVHDGQKPPLCSRRLAVRSDAAKLVLYRQTRPRGFQISHTYSVFI